MNIWYIHPYGGGPGIGRFYRPYYLAKQWQKLGHATTVLVADYHHLLDKKEPLAEHQNVDGVPYVALKAGAYQGNGLGRILNMVRFCKSLWACRKRVGKDLPKPDVIIISSPHPFAIYPGRFLAKQFGAKLVFEVRDLWPLSITEINGTSKWHPFVWLCGHAERFGYRHADVVASLLSGVERYMKERQMPFKHFVWVPNGFEQDTVSVDRSRLSEEAARFKAIAMKWREEGRFIIIHPGSMGPPNALDLLLDAMTLLNGRNLKEKYGVLLVGGGSERISLQQKAVSSGLDNVVFAGPISKAEVQNVLSHCNLGYCGGKDHDQVYRYGISLNKMMDFVAARLPMLLPFQAELPWAMTKSGAVIVVASNATAVAIALETAILEPKSEQIIDTLAPHWAEIDALYDYSQIARNYLDTFAAE